MFDDTANINSTRIPEQVEFENCFKSNPSDQAELFNSYFYRQFSEPSSYDITVDHTYNHELYINFNSNRICTILSTLNPDTLIKFMGPDKIHGLVLLNCAKNISKPLSILFSKSYYSGAIPNEWKAALVVPVHKKGAKSLVSNYRPISLTCALL